MKKFLVFVLSLVLLLCSCTAQKDEPFSLPPGLTYENSFTVTDGITLSLEYDNYPENVQSLKMILENRTDNVMLYGNGWSFEKYKYNPDGEDTWEKVDTKGDVAFTAEGYTLDKYNKQEFIIPTSFLKKGLTEGLYRITGCSLRVAKDDINLAYGGEYTDYPPYVLEFAVTKDSVSPAVAEEDILDSSDKYTLPEKEDWQWYTAWEAEKLYSQNGFMIWQYVENDNGLYAILYRKDTPENEYLNIGDKLMLDIFDRKTGKTYTVFEKEYVETDSVIPTETGGFEITVNDVLYTAYIKDNQLNISAIIE